MSTDLTVATTIVEQLGGKRFIAMTGASALVGGDRYVMFNLPPNTSGGTKMRIELTPMDEYTITVYKVNLRSRDPQKMCVEVARREHVYCDNLQEVFTDLTGLCTKL